MRVSMKEKKVVDIPFQNIISLKTQKGQTVRTKENAHLECHKRGNNFKL